MSDILERLRDPRIDGAWAVRQEAVTEITAMRADLAQAQAALREARLEITELKKAMAWINLTMYEWPPETRGIGGYFAIRQKCAELAKDEILTIDAARKED